MTRSAFLVPIFLMLAGCTVDVAETGVDGTCTAVLAGETVACPDPGHEVVVQDVDSTCVAGGGSPVRSLHVARDLAGEPMVVYRVPWEGTLYGIIAAPDGQRWHWTAEGGEGQLEPVWPAGSTMLIYRRESPESTEVRSHWLPEHNWTHFYEPPHGPVRPGQAPLDGSHPADVSVLLGPALLPGRHTIHLPEANPHSHTGDCGQALLTPLCPIGGTCERYVLPPSCESLTPVTSLLRGDAGAWVQLYQSRERDDASEAEVYARIHLESTVYLDSMDHWVFGWELRGRAHGVIALQSSALDCLSLGKASVPFHFQLEAVGASWLEPSSCVPAFEWIPGEGPGISFIHAAGATPVERVQGMHFCEDAGLDIVRPLVTSGESRPV